MNHRLLLVLALSTIPAVALADEAEDHVTKATSLYNIQEWALALKEYKAAYKLDPKPETLWAIAQTQRLSGDCRSAILSYKAFSRTASATGANTAQAFITKCQADLDAQQRTIEEADKPAPTPTPSPVVTAPPVVVEPPPSRPEEPRSWVFDPLGDVLFVVGIGGLATGGTFLYLGDSAINKAADKPTSGQYDTAKSDAESQQKIGVYAAIGGGVFTGLAIWRFVAVASRHHGGTAERLSVTPTRGGAFAAYLVRF